MMESFVQFLLENWRWILAIALAIVNILLVIFKRKVKVYDSVKEIILSMLPYFINVAEEYYQDGATKKSFVIDSICNFLKSKFSTIDVEDYLGFINDSIESILATPKKKGNVNA